MAKGIKQPKWDIYEAVILLEGFLSALKGNTPRNSVVKQVSSTLRKMAMNRGLVVDDVFRNVNGISYQIKSMESAYQGHTIYIPSTKLFDEVVALHRNDRIKYAEILEKAQYMANNKINRISISAGYMNRNEECTKTNPFSEELILAAELIIPIIFSNGLRKSSLIARKRFKTAFEELTGGTLPDEINLDELALAVGVEYEDKIYVPSKGTKKLLRDEIDRAKNNGFGVIFYEEFYKAFTSELSSDCIFSSELMTKVMAHIAPNMVFYKAYACFSKEDSLTKDILRAYQNDVSLSYTEIKNRLPYADLYQIRLVCSRNPQFVSMGDEVYALADRISISPKDIEKAKDSIANDISQNSFSMLKDISVEESENANPAINSYALKTLLFDKYLSDIYTRRRSLITRPGVKIRMYDVMKDYCLEFEKITLEEIETYEREVSGRFVYGLNAAFDSMVRVDKDVFVHRDMISFDIDAIDRAIDLYAKNHIYPLADIPSFVSFPYVEGYTWNVFLLDSFCAHYSKKYHSLGGPAQKGIIGAIYPIGMQFSNYSELLAHAAAESGLELTDGIISEYFSNHKYLLRKSNINEVLAKAQEIRLKED